MLWNEWKDLELQIVEMNDEVQTDRFERCGMHETSVRSRASDLWLPPRSWLRSATAQPSARDESSPYLDGSGPRNSTRPVARRSVRASASAATTTSVRSAVRSSSSSGAAIEERAHRQRGEWMTPRLKTRAPRNVLIVARDNKLARIAWAVPRPAQNYRAVPEGTGCISKRSYHQHR